jgi:SpoU rRNA methylase family enzyme
MALECKVSNSSTNSVKRLNNDAAVKAEYWLKVFGTSQVVPAAVLSGVFKVMNLAQAQERGLALFWSHDLDKLGAFIDTTR